MRWRSVAALLAVIVLALTTAYEAAQALGLITVGAVPGEDAPGAGSVGVAAVVAFLLAFVVVASSLGSPDVIASPVRQLLPLAPMASVVVGFYTYDPYYAPNHRRYSDYATTGMTLWICFVVGAAIGSAIVAAALPRFGMVFTLIVLVLCIPTALLGAGH